MDWPIDMPFPIFYKQGHMQHARSNGVEEVLKRKGLPFTWETVSGLRNEFSRIHDPWKNLDPMKDSPQALAVDDALARNECRTFILSPELIAALAQTTGKNVPGDLVRVPFNVIYIDLSKSKLTIWHALSECDEIVRGILVISRDDAAHKRVCHVTGYDPAVTTIGYILSYDPNDDDWDGSTWGCSAMVWGSIDGVYNMPNKKDNTMAVSENPLVPQDGEFRVMGANEIELWAIWINALLYINSVNADVKEGWLHQDMATKMRGVKGKRKRDMRRHMQSGGKVFRVGHTIHLPQMSDGEKSASLGGKIGVRFQVRGHWHLYWTGSNRFGTRVQKLKWLAPYWKGPEMAEVVHGTYVVD